MDFGVSKESIGGVKQAVQDVIAKVEQDAPKSLPELLRACLNVVSEYEAVFSLRKRQ